MEKIDSTLKKVLALGALYLFQASTLLSQTVLNTESFETDGEGSRYTSNTFMDCATEQDVFMRTNMNPLGAPTCGITVFGSALTGITGTFMWVFEDIRGSTGACVGCRSAGQITSTLINITSYGSLQMRINVACSNNNGARWESADSVNLQASINGGAFRTVGRFMGKGTPTVGSNLGIDSNLDGAITGADPVTNVDQTTFATYTFTIPGTGSSLRWRIDADQAGGTEEFAFDNIQILGTVIVPVKWASFSGQQLDESVKLAWTTTEEVNVREFIVERLAGDGTYTPIGTVDAQGTPSSYDFIDPNPVSGINQYRIQQVDADNAFSFSDVIEVQVNPAYRTRLYPNPMNDGCRLVVEGEPVSGTLRIIDNVGRICRSVAVENASEIEILRENLEAGSYHIRLDLSNGRALTKKLLVHD
ncbi:MAG: T9SS type A sorting domain-containing protein [Bacteroidetes bacterium]|nr:T9SS type A sorting domain-containing protein [Bacteroidota bacterium]